MSFDFFNEGIKEEAGPKFTKEEQDFLNSKLTFLDSKRTGQIPIGTVIHLFNLTKVNSAVIKKILQNCKVEGKRALSYEDMKKVFRGISLAQKGIEPSTININANIKTPMPKFYDDDDEEEEEEPAKPNPPVKDVRPPQAQPQSQPPPKSPSNNQPNPASFAEFGQFVQPQKPAQQPPKQEQPKQEQPKQQPPLQQRSSAQQEQDSSGNKLKQFEAYWSRLNTKNNKIDGGQVKNLCKNLAQRSNLAKAWKICSHTNSGSLTKGEFYVFLELVGSHHELPEGLSQGMKAIIAKIDKANQNGKDRNASQLSQLGATQLFDNFGKSQLSITAPPITKTNSQSASQKAAVTALTTQTTAKLSSKLQVASKNLQSSEQASQEQLLQLRRQQQAMNNMMGEVEQFLMQVNNKTNKMRTEIDQLKANQTTLNERFNKVCMAMNQIIIRQNSIIDELTHQLTQQNRINEDKANVLEKYVLDREAHCHEMEDSLHRSPPLKSQPIIQASNDKHRPSAQHEHAREQHEHHEEEHERQHERQHEEEHFEQKQSSPLPEHVSPQREAKLTPESSPEHNHQPEPVKQENEQINKQQQAYMNRMRMKQMQVIQLIHYITPISQEEYPKIAQRITAYSEEQLNTAYSGLYEKLLEKQRAEQQAQERAEKGQKGRPSHAGEDEFNTSNFKNGEKQEQAEGEDFFS